MMYYDPLTTNTYSYFYYEGENYGKLQQSDSDG